ncbi:hypothetical protein TCDM_13473 [Trypanosoma cruzi Dm28c]|uniref:Uncharacterized protein n=1 Tax=Trypanosoma cruzi Dm28c TaxID=1416333 RepID=V5A2S5_TRYCR|nr:hypothetical protein TCDM_13473 [Trypanosoma cruzi Dm28c]
MRATHHRNTTIRWTRFKNNQKKGALLARASFFTHPQPPMLLFPLLRPSQLRHAHLNTRPSSTGLGTVMRSRCAQRVLAHVLHSLQPHGRSGWPSCTASRCPCGWSTPHILSIHGLVLQEAAERSHVCAEDPNVRGVFVSHPHPITRLRPFRCSTNKGGAMEEKEKPAAQQTQDGARSSNATHVATEDRAMRAAQTQPQRKGRSAYNSTPRSFTFPDGTAQRLTAGRGAVHEIRSPPSAAGWSAPNTRGTA